MKRILTLILACLMLISIGFADGSVQMPPSMTMTSEDGTVVYTYSPCNYGWTYPTDTPDEWCGVDACGDAPTSPATYKTIDHLLLTEETAYMLDWGNNSPDQIEIIGWDNAVFQDVEHAGDYQDTYVEFADNLITLKPDHVYSIHVKWLDGEAKKEAHGNASYYIVTEKGIVLPDGTIFDKTAQQCYESAWLLTGYAFDDLLENSEERIREKQIYSISGIVTALVPGSVQNALFQIDDGELPFSLLITNLSDTEWEQEKRYQIYAEVYSYSDSYHLPWMLAGYTKIIE